MQLIKNTTFIILVSLVLASCIEPYPLEDLELNDGSLVVSGTITNEAGWQTIEISRASDVSYPAFQGVSGCLVEVISQSGDVFEFRQMRDGCYQHYFNADDIKPGMGYQLTVFTPSGSEYASDFEIAPQNAPVGRLYGERLDKDTEESGIKDLGVQMYYDFEGTQQSGTYYKFGITETWEYHSVYPIYWEYFAGYRKSDIKFKLYYCYKTEENKDIFTLSTQGLSENKYPRLQLNWEPQTSQKFNYKYSILLQQYAVNKNAYFYFEALKENSQENGGLYDKQPITLRSNLKNIKNGDEKVLGYFTVATVVKKRFMFEDNFGLDEYNLTSCDAYVDDKIGMRPPESWPIYVVMDKGELKVAPKFCFDCTMRGGTTVKPDFW